VNEPRSRNMNIPSNAKCPKCSSLLKTVTGGYADITIPIETRQYHGLTYSCPNCQTLLGIEMDPIAMKLDIVDALFERLRNAAV